MERLIGNVAALFVALSASNAVAKTTNRCKAVAIAATTTETRELDGVTIKGVKKGEIVTGLKTFSENKELGDFLYCTSYATGFCYDAKALRLLNCKKANPENFEDEGRTTRINYKLVPIL